MITNTDMAQVLEDAADLYQAEKVHWCQSSYVEDNPVLTVCATTALGLAAGLGSLMPMAIDLADGRVIRNSQSVLVDQLGMVPNSFKSPTALTWSRKAQALYLAARGRVEQELRARASADPERYPPTHLPAFNDEDETTLDQVVDLFQAVAKDLRNEGGVK